MVEAQTKRLFFALYPSACVRQAIMTSVPDSISPSLNRVTCENLHLTLLFLGATNDIQQTAYLAAAATIQAEQFDLELDYMDQFTKANILWLGARHVPKGLMDLYNRLLMALHTTGFESSSQTYRPHITLARNFRGQPPLYKHHISWHVQSFSLMESCSTDQGVRYIELQHWPLS